jgi:LPS sulfotransferase NodH
MAGKAHEWLLELKDDMFNTPAALQQVLWERGSVVGNAVKSQEWHRRARASPRSVDLINADFFDAIPYLYRERSMREAGIQEFLSEGNIVPLTIVYEDFIHEYEKTLRKILEFLELDPNNVEIPFPSLAPTLDSISEVWVQRFREELQEGWTNPGW